MRPLDSSPDSWGAHKASFYPVQGPSSYTRLAIPSPPGVPVAGGQIVQAVSFGMKLFDKVIAGMTDSGLYRVEAIPVSASNQFQGAQQPNYRLVWYVVATGAEVANAVDLSAEYVRALGIGPK